MEESKLGVRSVEGRVHHATDQNDQNPRWGHSILAEISEFPVNGKRFYFKQNF